MWDGSLVVAANNNGTCYVWRLLRGTQVLHLILLQNLQCCVFLISIYREYFLYYTFPFVSLKHISSQRSAELKIMYSSRMTKVCVAMRCISLSWAHFFVLRVSRLVPVYTEVQDSCLFITMINYRVLAILQAPLPPPTLHLWAVLSDPFSGSSKCRVSTKHGWWNSVQAMTNFEPLHKLQAHDKYILKCLLSPEYCEPNKYVTVV